MVALLEKAKGDLPAKPKKVQSVPVVQSHISAKDIDDIMNDDDGDSAAPPAKSAGGSKAGSGKPAAGKAGAAKKTTTVRGKVREITCMQSLIG